MFWNIEYKGKLKGDIEQISSGRPLSEGSVMFKEPDSITKVFVQGALFAIPIVALMIIFACFRIGAVYGKPTNMRFMDFMVPFAIGLALLFASQYVHEFIHAFLMPKEVKKQIYVAPESGALFVYCEDHIPKNRFMISLLGPAVILGFIPYIIWIFIVPALSFPVSLVVVMYSVSMVLCAIGDYLNFYNCITQVPKDGKVFNRGLHSYWV
nr:DUF3267 domain-containing protein [uncultured Butyrivibrio sp.]